MRNNQDGFTSVAVGVPCIGDRIIMRPANFEASRQSFHGIYMKMDKENMLIRTDQRGVVHFGSTWFWKRID
jgi:hypothetical protein